MCIQSCPRAPRVVRNKYKLFYEKGKIPSQTNEEGIGQPYIGATDLDTTEEVYSLYTEDEGLPQANKEDLLVLWDGARAGLAGTHKKGVISSTIVKICGDNSIFQPFLYWYYKGFEFYFSDMVNGTTIPHMNRKYIEDIGFVDWPMSMQEKIANYLDSKCSQLDTIIAKQEQIIEKLKEYKLSLITEAVTKGLDPKAKMKDSGVEWLGSYPAHWKYIAFKNVLNERMEKNDPIQTDERLSLSIDKGVTLYADKTTNLDRFKDDVSQYKLAPAGDLVLNSLNMIVGAIGVSKWFGCVSPAYYTYYDNKDDHITVKFCDYLLRCKTMRKVLFSLGKGIMAIDRGDDRVNTCRLKVSRTDLRSLKIPLPPVDEQKAIVEFLNEKEVFIDKTISDRENCIDKLRELKKSLIYEVVTGKKEV